LGYRISKYGLEEKLQKARRIAAEQRGGLPVGAPEASDPT